MAKNPIRVLVTGATGEIGYALAPMIAGGRMLGVDQPLSLHLHNILTKDSEDLLDSMKAELEDAQFPLLNSILVTTDLNEAWDKVEIAILLPEIPKREGVTKNILMRSVASTYKSHAVALKQVASPDCKVLVIADPTEPILSNTIAYIMNECGPAGSTFPAKNISSLSRLDLNRTEFQISATKPDDNKIPAIKIPDIRNVVVWGVRYPDLSNATVKITGLQPHHCSGRRCHCHCHCPCPPTVQYKPLHDLFGGKEEAEIVKAVLERGAVVINNRKGHPPALSTAAAACDHINDWILGTAQGAWVSMGVYSDGSLYDVPAGLFFSFPVTCSHKQWKIKDGLKIPDDVKKYMGEAVKDLTVERDLAKSYLSN